MKLTIILAAATLAACTTPPEMIAAQAGRCTQIGYTPGTIDHAQCVERGTIQQQGAQNDIATTALNAAIINAIFR